MANALKIDGRAFGRGVDEVLQLKPMRRAVNSLVFGSSPSKASEVTRSARVECSVVSVTTRKKHDKAS